MKDQWEINPLPIERDGGGRCAVIITLRIARPRLKITNVIVVMVSHMESGLRREKGGILKRFANVEIKQIKNPLLIPS
ncbi:MAG: hypothetical protein ACFFBD_12305 [Candidatus Hodarchaeota archaeon]